ncbi:TetR/AcrR family transcriptional regulator, transcriptional repressor for nem operon [Paenibacillus catalpae]|uniref:TetR/AcrR family transcriptional regulator, transcriptional repressor for nem operon n=1 Tax=Paenibacillus catalpae TaxID=1045775 RepID=A0A1I2GXJ2_9BACL|nr:TetR/AcrR family transcriptional regulator [Paenibacillus catalpae]SFF21860.1 TetR/AcrR family transcriptional regulator, transcriptional repressor for nem operon [Paenibacillus catalpae]
MNSNKKTAELILDTAQALVQEVGFNGFSYAHIAEKIGIRTASIHYHFPNKEDLGEALITRYQREFVATITQIDGETQNNLEKLRKYVNIFSIPVDNYCTCLSVMLSSDLATLSEKVGAKLADFFTANLAWVERVLEEGRREGQLRFEGAASLQAHIILAALQGAQLLARSFRDVNRFTFIADGVISALT